MFCALVGKISGERLQDHWSSGILLFSYFCSKTKIVGTC